MFDFYSFSEFKKIFGLMCLKEVRPVCVVGEEEGSPTPKKKQCESHDHMKF